MAHKTNYTVVRNDGYMATAFNIRERHNERKNENYYNGDIEKERSHLNIHFRQHLHADGTPETYAETFKRLMTEGVISDKWHKPTSKSFDEVVFDVNTDYFEHHGGYEYARKFYEEAYRCAVAEVGGEQYILSAVLHADERNVNLSEKLGRDVYHYHLHVVYVPVVEKREYFRRKKDEPEGERKLKAVYAQISHAKKWPDRVPVERDGKTVILNSYSLLQDRYFEHMRAAGFEGFERGARGSTAEHLEVLDYKIQQDKKRLEQLDTQVGKKETRIEKLDAAITVREKAKATIAEVEAMGKPALLGGYSVTADEMTTLKTLAKKAVMTGNNIAAWKKKAAAFEQQIAELKQEVSEVTRARDYWKRKFEDLNNMVKPFLTAIINFPDVLKNFIARHWRERQLQQQQQKSRVQEELR